MKPITAPFRLLILLAFLSTFAAPAAAKESAYQTGFTRWRAEQGQFSGWTLSGAKRTSFGLLEIDPTSAAWETDPYPAGGYYGGNFYNGGNYQVGAATSPEMAVDFPFQEAIASWNAATPPGTWIETLISAKVGERWTKWYNLGIWASGDETVQRHSVRLQGDADGYVAVDTLVLSKKVAASAFQLKLRLFSADGVATPSVANVSLAYSTTPGKTGELSSGNPADWGTLVDVPECSQMVYPNGGEVWCSPTSTSMVLGYWIKDDSTCAEREPVVVAGVYDWIYDGHGNWPFNTAYAATRGMEGYVARFTSLAQAEPWVAAGVPVVVSFAWKKGELTGAAVSSSNGHLAVLVGFDASGNPIINDPAAATNDTVRRTYLRSEFEPLWLQSSGGTVYLIYPPGFTDLPVIP